MLRDPASIVLAPHVDGHAARQEVGQIELRAPDPGHPPIDEPRLDPGRARLEQDVVDARVAVQHRLGADGQVHPIKIKLLEPVDQLVIAGVNGAAEEFLERCGAYPVRIMKHCRTGLAIEQPVTRLRSEELGVEV